MFQVFDNNKPADASGHNVHHTWNNSTFSTFEEAHQYANQWLAPSHGLVILKLNQPYDYSGYGDIIEIREVQPTQEK